MPDEFIDPLPLRPLSIDDSSSLEPRREPLTPLGRPDELTPLELPLLRPLELFNPLELDDDPTRPLGSFRSSERPIFWPNEALDSL